MADEKGEKLDFKEERIVDASWIGSAGRLRKRSPLADEAR